MTGPSSEEGGIGEGRRKRGKGRRVRDKGGKGEGGGREGMGGRETEGEE